MDVVYLLRHTYEYGKDCEHESTKELGVYSSPEKAEEAKNRYAELKGFNRYPEDCFFICKYLIDKDYEWVEGFMTWQEIEQYQEENNLCRGDEYKKSIYREAHENE